MQTEVGSDGRESVRNIGAGEKMKGIRQRRVRRAERVARGTTAVAMVGGRRAAADLDAGSFRVWDSGIGYE